MTLGTYGSGLYSAGLYGGTPPIFLPSGTAFTVRLYEPLTPTNGSLIPLDEFTFPSDQTLLQITTERPGGFGAATVGLDMFNVHHYRPIALAKPVRQLMPWAHVQILAGLTVIWEGQVIQPSEDGTGNVIGFLAHGYWSAFNDRRFQEDAFGEATTGQIADMIRQRAAPYVRRGNVEQVIDPRVRRMLAEFSGLPGGQVLDAINRMGDRDGNPIDVMFWQGPTMWILPRIPPKHAEYALDAGEHLTPETDWQELYGRVRTQYTDEQSTTQFTDWREDHTFVDRFGRMRETELPGGRVSRAGADQIARVFLERHTQPLYSYTVELDRNEGLRGLAGGYTAPWLVRANQWVELADKGALAIMYTSYDSMRETLRLDIAEQRADWERLLQRHQQDLAALSRGISPLTGARL